jgi:DNA-directed RNA polymerase specialized sigma24 family protein
VRVSAFAILRCFLAREHCNGFQSPDVVDGPLALEDITQGLASVGCALSRLNFYDREAVILTKAVRFSDSDTAAICECSPAMVGRRARCGVAKLAEMMPAASVRSLASAVRLAVSPDANATLQ